MLNAENTKKMRQMVHALMEHALWWGREMGGKNMTGTMKLQGGPHTQTGRHKGLMEGQDAWDVLKKDVVPKNIAEGRGK